MNLLSFQFFSHFLSRCFLLLLMPLMFNSAVADTKVDQTTQLKQNTSDGLNLPATMGQRFQFLRDKDGKLIGVRAPWLRNPIQAKKVVDSVKNDIQKEQQLVQAYAQSGLMREYEQEVRNILADLEDNGLVAKNVQFDIFSSGNGSGKAMSLQEILDYLEQAILSLGGIDSQGTFAEIEQEGLLSEYETEMRSEWTHFQLDIIARTDDPRFFYRRAAIHKVLDWGLDQAKKRFSNVPILNTISFIMKELHRMAVTQRQFAQNALLYYLDHYSPEQLGLTTAEFGHILSSIYESRIGWLNYFESNRAAENWDTYGSNLYYQFLRGATARANNYVQRQQPQGNSVILAKRLNYAFAEFFENDRKVIRNLFNTTHSFSPVPALAYDYESPNRVRNLRNLIRVGQFGLSFLPLPGWITSNIHSFASSAYQPHTLTEGALAAWFEDQGNKAMVEQVMNQKENIFLAW